MACIYRRKRSPYWWIKFRSSTGKITYKSTKFRTNVPLDTRKAKTLQAQLTLKELSKSSFSERERWECWVQNFIDLKYQNSTKTKSRFTIYWRALFAYFSFRKIIYPSQLTYDDCIGYLNWRKAGSRQHGVLAAHHNTAIRELKFLHTIMREAVKRGYVSSNPASKLGLQLVSAKEKPEISEVDLHRIREALKQEPEWMRTAFEISLYTGCRLRETQLKMDDVDLDRRTIYFKGKGGKFYLHPIRDELLPLLTKLKVEGRTYTLEMPRLPSKDFWFFFKRIGLPQYCFHCLRVTYISRGARSGVPEHVMMRLVNHASATIHDIYRRCHLAQDLAPAAARICLPGLAENLDDSLTTSSPLSPLPSPLPAACPPTASPAPSNTVTPSAQQAPLGCSIHPLIGADPTGSVKPN